MCNPAFAEAIAEACNRQLACAPTVQRAGPNDQRSQLASHNTKLMTPQEAIRLIARNEISEFDVDWRDYQRLVWWLVSQETRIQAEPRYSSEISHGEDSGVIDIIVCLKGSSVSLFGDDNLQAKLRIFIECKQYRATLSLDKLGKVFCHSILEEPDALWIVSPRRLSLQASDYAKRIFKTNDPVARSPLLRRTRFRHWQLRELITNRLADAPPVSLQVTDWHITQSTPFGSAIVASARSATGSSKRSVTLDTRASFNLRLFLDGGANNTEPLQLALECDESNETLILLRSRCSSSALGADSTPRGFRPPGLAGFPGC